ncbi:ATP11 protein-domain-containing protein [Panaeolus papilionaceus]|nr:ATP11 protein-domain-containing protein [Panaeolus papilionaceus]
MLSVSAKLLNVTPRLARLTRAVAIRRSTVLPLRLLSTAGTKSTKSRYAQKLEQLAKERGVSVNELLEKAKEEEAKRRAEEAEKLKSTLKPQQSVDTSTQSSSSSSPNSSTSKTAPKWERKDAAPYKPLSSFLNLPRILSTPHTADQVSALWVAYHTSRSGGTGRGYVCATIPLDVYNKLGETGNKYRSFVVPIARTQKDATTGEEKTSHEFFYLQWDFHPPPVVPSAEEDPFVKPSTSTGSNPRISTVIFTPLDEYKRRGSFATPYLILTLYTDLVTTHGVVLLRGEITPSSASASAVDHSDRFLLSQQDAQSLLLSLQQFYLWTLDNSKQEHVDAMSLLRTFHEKPEEFKWEELIKLSDTSNPIR